MESYIISWILAFILWYFGQSLVYWGSFVKLGLNIEQSILFFLSRKILRPSPLLPSLYPYECSMSVSANEQFNKLNIFVLKEIKLINHTRFFADMLSLGFYIFYLFIWNFHPLDYTNLLNLVYYSTYYWSMFVTILVMNSILQI